MESDGGEVGEGLVADTAVEGLRRRLRGGRAARRGAGTRGRGLRSRCRGAARSCPWSLAPGPEHGDGGGVELDDPCFAALGSGDDASFSADATSLGERDDLLADRRVLLVKVDVGPAEAEDFTASAPGGGQDRPCVARSDPPGSGDERRQLGWLSTSCISGARELFADGRGGLVTGVELDEPCAHGVFQRGVQDGVDVADSAGLEPSRLRSAYPSGLQQSDVHPIDSWAVENLELDRSRRSGRCGGGRCVRSCPRCSLLGGGVRRGARCSRGSPSVSGALGQRRFPAAHRHEAHREPPGPPSWWGTRVDELAAAHARSRWCRGRGRGRRRRTRCRSRL